MEKISVKDLLDAKSYSLELKLLSGEDHLERQINQISVHKLGLVLAGIKFQLEPGQIQIYGGTEHAYLESLSEIERARIIERLFDFEMPCMIITRAIEPSPELLRGLKRHPIALLGSPLATAEFIQRLTRLLEDSLSPSLSLHGVLVDVLGIGILMLGQSGIGKSETALDLVLRGHQLVADDIVEMHRRGQYTLVGKGSEVIRFHMEIRGLGIINIKDLFGVSAIRERKKIDLVIELVEWDERKEYDRLGLEEESYTILGTEVPHLTIPIRPGRNLTTIIEVAARNQLLKMKGYYSARDFQKRLMEEVLREGGATDAAGEEFE
jgi:HPr kinase/phosphorylase